MKKDLVSLFRCLTHGVYVIGVGNNEKFNAFTAAWVMQASFSPPLLALSIYPDHSSYTQLIEGGMFTVNVLPAERMGLAKKFGQPAGTGKFNGVNWHHSKAGVPILEDAIAWFECRFSHECRAGDHVLIVGHVIDGALLDTDSEPMNYRDTGNMDGSERFYPDDFTG